MTGADDSLALRVWMDEQYGGLRADRSTESYALEFLQTEQANRELAQARANLTLTASQLTYFADWVQEMLGRLPGQIAQVEKLAQGEGRDGDQTGAEDDEQ